MLSCNEWNWRWFVVVVLCLAVQLQIILCYGNLREINTTAPLNGTSESFAYDLINDDFNLSVCDATVTMELTSNHFMIGGLFPLHYTKNDKPVLNPYGITWVEAMQFAIREINADPKILPGITLGYDMRDSCNDRETATRHVLDFTLDASYYARLVRRNSSDSDGGLSEQALEKQLNDSAGQCLCSKGAINVLLAVVGGAASDVSAAVSNILGVSSTPQISYSSTSVGLSDKSRYSSFMRTIPADSFQAKAIADFLQHFNWTYVNVYAADDDYGRLGLDELRRETKNRNICLAVDRTFTKSLKQDELDRMLDSLQSVSSKARVVILWCQIGEAVTILQEASRRNLTGFIWMGTESWGNSIELFGLDEQILHGIIGIKPTIETVPKFEAHLRGLNPLMPTDNPWLDGYWKSKFNCRDTTVPLGAADEATNLTLVGSVKNDNVTYHLYCSQGNVTGAQLPFNKYTNVLSAVYAVAYGLHEMLGCGNATCHLDRIASSQETLLDIMRRKTFTLPGSANEVFFDANGDIASASYTFTNLQAQRGAVGGHIFVDIGVWDGTTGALVIDTSKVVWANDSIRQSQCSKACPPGYHKVTGSSACCWSCSRCPPEQISRYSNSAKCQACAIGEIANGNRTACLQLRVLRFVPDSVEGAIVLAASVLGLACAFFVLLTFVKYWSTPVVKSSNREMCVTQLICIAAAFFYPLFYLLDFSTLGCIVRPLYLGLLLTVSNSIICVKTYRLYRIFNKTLHSESKFLKNSSQMLVVCFVVLLQVIGILIFHLYKQPTAQHLINSKDRTIVYHCDDHEHMQLFIALCYVMVLKLTALWMAFKARKLPENFNEARFITFCMLTTILVWSVFIPIHFSVSKLFRVYMICLFSAVANFTTIISLYSSKLKIILFHPNLNDPARFRRHTMQMTVKTFVQQPARLLPASHAGLRSLHADTPNGSLHSFGKFDPSQKLGVSLTDFNLDMALNFDAKGIT